MSIQKNNLEQIIADTAAEMNKIGYTENSLKHYWEVWKRYIKFTSVDSIDRTDMNNFLEIKYSYNVKNDTTVTTRYQRNAIRALNVLEYYEKFNKIYIRLPLSNPIKNDIPFEGIYDSFINNLNTKYAKATVHTHDRVITRFLYFLTDMGVNTLKELSTNHISEFILEITGHRGKVSYELGSLRKFFRYLYKNNIVETDFSMFVPATNHLRLKEHLPTVWEEDDINKIIRSIDLANPVGKRDYAMILLAIRLGLRGSDIKNICFSNIDWVAETITITQVKTQETTVLPLLEDVGNAIIDYLKNGRPISNSPNIFLSLRAPYNALSKENHLHQVLNKYINRSGIIITADKSHGMHSLRHFLATNLLKQGTSLPIISSILGHKDSNTTAEYLRVDIEQLRCCNLEVPGYE